MREVLEAFPGAQRALFRRYHIGGCSSCGFQPGETVEELCARNNRLDVGEVLSHIASSHEEDRRMLVEPRQLSEWLALAGEETRVLDIRSREEFGAASIRGSVFLSQAIMQEVMGKWPREGRVVIVDHLGKSVLDAAAYFVGHGFTRVHGLLGGIDAWSVDVDPTVPRYRLG